MSDFVCLLCKQDVHEVEDLNNFTQISNTPFRLVLENALDHYLPMLNSDLRFCENCVDLLNEFDIAESTYKSIKQKVLNYCDGFEVYAKKSDASCLTDEFWPPELFQVKKSTDEIADDVEFEFVDSNYFEQTKYEIRDFMCYICKAGFDTEHEMTAHSKVSHHITIRKTHSGFMCYICKMTFDNQEQLIEHSKAFHQITMKKEPGKLSKRKRAVTNKITIRKLGVAKKPIMIGDLKLNLGEEDEIEYQDNVKLFIKTGPKKKDIQNKPKRSSLRPIIINNTNISTDFMDYPMDDDEDFKPTVKAKYKCKTCLKCYHTAEELDNHACGQSIVEQPYICEICGQTFKKKPNLNAHISGHNGIFPFVCSYCTKPFTKKAALLKHLNIHTGETQYQCDLCGKSFIHTSSFSTHMRLHAGQKNFKCIQCGLSVFSRQHLTRHMRVHTGEKPYSCYVCPKRFAERYNLYTHLKVHKGYDYRIFKYQLET